MDYTLDNFVSHISLVCIPHGQFRDIFGDSIIGAGKDTTTIRNNIRFLVNNIINNSDHSWRYKELYSRK